MYFSCQFSKYTLWTEKCQFFGICENGPSPAIFKKWKEMPGGNLWCPYFLNPGTVWYLPEAPKLTTCALNRVWTVRQTAFFELCGVSWTPLDSFKRRHITSSRSDFYSITTSHWTLRPLAPFLPCSDICCNRRKLGQLGQTSYCGCKYTVQFISIYVSVW